MSKVFVIAAHPDDEILGVGASIRKHIEYGDECYALILGEGVTSRYETRDKSDEDELGNLKKEIYNASKIIGYKETFIENLRDNRFDSYNLLEIIKIVEKYIEKIKPDIIYTHHYGDVNIDHKLTFEAVLTATRPIGKNCVKEIYCFETVSSTEWNFTNQKLFQPNYFIDISEYLDYKLEAMKEYVGELREFPHPRSIKNLQTTAQKWGSTLGVEYAEAFEVVRILK